MTHRVTRPKFISGCVLITLMGTRARLNAANGSADNQVILVDARADFMALFAADPATSPAAQRQRELVRQMDRWLDNIAADRVAGTTAAKVARNKPADLADGCWATDGEKIVERASYDGPGRCNQLYPSHGDPRIAAGAPVADDILKCALKPLSPADYAHSLSADQLQQLKTIFAAGVCDYSRPGIGQQVTQTTRQQYNLNDKRQ